MGIFRVSCSGAAFLAAAVLVASQAAGAPKGEADKNPEMKAPVEAPRSVTLPTLQKLEPEPARLGVEMFTASGEGLTHTARVVHGRSMNSALESFDLRFENGDHKIQKIGLINAGDHILASFNDDGGEDPFSFRGRYVHIAGYDDRAIIASAIEENCNERCTIRLPELAEGQTALLAGFELERLHQDDYNVRGIGIVLLPDRGVADVIFYDDRGPDFSDFFPAPFIPFEYQAVDRITNTQRAAIRVKLQVLIVPQNIIESEGRIIGADREAATQARTLVSAEDWNDLRRDYALLGFGVTFGNSDHFLQEFSIDIKANPVVKFQDNGTDDPISWFIDYATFKRQQPKE